MSELKRYDVRRSSSGGVDEVASKSGEYVRAADALAREDELEREVTALKQRLRRSKAAKDKVYEIGQSQTQKSKQRNADLIELLRSLRINASPDLFSPGQLAQVDAAIKTAGSTNKERAQ